MLHRDINPHNVRCRRTKDRLIGVLCDFDLAGSRDEIESKERNASNQLSRYTTGEPTKLHSYKQDVVGTRAFTACELLSPNYAPVQTYKHDLESFFYLILWHCGTHNPKKRAYTRNLDAWYGSGNEDNEDADLKATLLSTSGDEPRSNAVLQRYLWRADRMYEGIIGDWIKPLRELFICSGIRYTFDCHMKLERDGELVEGGKERLDALWAMSYPKFESELEKEFMAIIGVDLDA